MSKKYNFKVGDKVKIRQWDDMRKEFGIGFLGNINTRYSFVTEMKHLCGRVATITRISDGSIGLDFEDKSGRTCWNYSTDMIEPLKNECIVIYRKGSEVIALDKTTGKKAVAKCSPDDVFDFNIGSKLAFERLLEEPKYKEVKRKAKVGEYVKVVDKSDDESNEYENGDILKIVKVSSISGAYYKDQNGKFLDEKEYVVLEGYEPPKEEKKKTYFNGKAVYTGEGRKNHIGYTVGKIYEFKDGFCRDNDRTKRPFGNKYGYETLPKCFIKIVE